MNELERMRSGEPYDFSDSTIAESIRNCREKMERLNRLPVYDEDYRKALEDLIPGIPASSTIIPPFYCDHGHGIRLEEEVFVNMNCTFLDCGLITIGAHTKIGPNCQIYTPQHPLDHVERRLPVETGLPVHIGSDCWLGGGVVVCPGVRIGDRCVIAAGSVVTRDVPDDSLAAGNPPAVKRNLR